MVTKRRADLTLRRKADLTLAIAPHPKTPAEFEHRVRSLALVDALQAAEWLNATKGKVRADVLQIREDLETLNTMLDTLHQQVKAFRENLPKRDDVEERLQYLHKGMEYQKLQVQFNKLQSTLTERLLRYSFYPEMIYDIPSGVSRYNLFPRKPRGRQIEMIYRDFKLQVDAATVVGALCRLAANRELHKLRLCDWCKKKWRVSERAMDRFCSRECLDADYKARPDYKERRRKIQKDHRENEKRKAAQALARVKER